jgi:hypothetical protein
MAVIELHLLPALASARYLQMKCLHGFANSSFPSTWCMLTPTAAAAPLITPPPLDVVNVPAHSPLLLGHTWS